MTVTLTTQDVMDVLGTIPDPEMPISIVDLGIVEDVRVDEAVAAAGGCVVHVTILPTFVGCPALPMIEDDIRSKLSAMDGVDEVTVRFVHEPAWSVDRITAAGREQLKEHGVTVPETGDRLIHEGSAGPGVELRTSAIPCPFCGSSETRLDSPYGPTRCRMIYYCSACRNGFEHLKRV
jgi:ring-1,2-phenylacetyl-CoA epoxidase subunit PaaD